MFSAFTILRAYAGDKYFIGASTDFFPCAFLIVGPSFFLIVFRNKSLIPVKLDKYYKKKAESINISKKICNFANEMD